MSTTTSEAEFQSSDNEDSKPIVLREFTAVQLPYLSNRDVQAFNGVHPPSADEVLTEQQLLDRIKWSNETNEKLTMTLDSLQKTLQAEWTAKELLLEKILEKEIGGEWNIV